MADSADSVRENVEATLHRLVGLASAGPCAVMRVANRTIAESIGLARTVVTLAVDGLLGWEVDGGVGPLAPAAGDAPLTTTRVVAPSTTERHTAADAGERPRSPDLAIPGYEDLAASHIVARLDRLSPAELAEIRTFEVANRGRRTVVGKIDQLLARV